MKIPIGNDNLLCGLCAYHGEKQDVEVRMENITLHKVHDPHMIAATSDLDPTGEISEDTEIGQEHRFFIFCKTCGQEIGEATPQTLSRIYQP